MFDGYRDVLFIFKNISNINVTGKGIAFGLKAEFDNYVSYMSEWYHEIPSFQDFIKDIESYIQLIESNHNLNIINKHESESLFFDVLESIRIDRNEIKNYDTFTITATYL